MLFKSAMAKRRTQSQVWTRYLTPLVPTVAVSGYEAVIDTLARLHEHDLAGGLEPPWEFERKRRWG